MKTLLLMRHAKSSWKENKLKDIDRPLNKRGKKDSAHMGELLASKKLCPQLILSSTALRARLTAQTVAEKCGYRGEISYLDSLYMAEPNTIAAAIASLPEEENSVLLIGHNPGMEALVQMMLGKIESLPTSAIAYFNLSITHWNEFSIKTQANQCDLWTPPEKKDRK